MTYFDMPPGYNDADLEMANLEELGRRASKRYRAFTFEQRDALRAGATIESRRRNPDTDEPYTALVRPSDEDEVGPILEYSADGGATWFATAKAARLAHDVV